ncbi:bifunctional adenosylcobinamide kinase/adenosylcobinamide-phosphate guanylyltransferase [Planomicrobium sp. CPCC 101079]|uniref:bifunctional adenosylcobinamide kinase/adenosylcobinamide-phosphate guanylyltransferase n=1 Tax=Planomicrobium sp. CPCC 101079 TaxID=2599618 RepID=UPI0011B765E7|nr:bifunctional adenosylcobinamide kinase/adenosylcobinamide-phosphate guanylyltransferase [Planomicrobium sp. CPCC 101079]TWT03493.1 cobinamide kinase [Planomicrobium sp. CPCC 101079]
MARGQMIFVSGGVRSGKSAYAEQLLMTAGAARCLYLASGQAHDAEMEARIRQHQHDRSGQGWTTIEQPMNMEQVLPEIRSGDAVLWDCVTTWLANELYEGWERNSPCAEEPGCMEQKWLELQETLAEILNQAQLLVVVSNEVLDDFIRDETYQRWLGKIHQWLVIEADRAFEMENGAVYRRK